MKTKRIDKSSSVKFSIFLLALSCFYLFAALFQYTFVPFNGLILNIFSSTIILWFTIREIKNRNEKTKLCAIFSAILPLIAIFFVIVKGVTFDMNEINIYLYVAQSYLTLICSILMFFFSGLEKIFKINLSLVYLILLVPIFFILFIAICFVNFGANTVVEFETSPNSIYLAEIIDSNQGALGGNTSVDITRQDRNINLLIGELRKRPETIYTGKWGEFETMTLRWEGDEILYINENKYNIQDAIMN